VKIRDGEFQTGPKFPGIKCLSNFDPSMVLKI